jgi:hypothetical protein
VTVVPANLKIYHITHFNNLPGIVKTGVIYSDAECRRQCLDCDVVGMSAIKQRRLTELVVECHPETKVGEYVPFYFCPRSIMLYILHMANHLDLTYRGGQRPIVHLQADLRAVVRWAEEHQIRWAFSDRNAGAYVARFYKEYDALGNIDWEAVASTDFREVRVMEAKQAEFLFFGSFPWTLVEEIGVIDAATAGLVREALQGAPPCPPITVKHGWYF